MAHAKPRKSWLVCLVLLAAMAVCLVVVCVFPPCRSEVTPSVEHPLVGTWALVGNTSSKEISKHKLLKTERYAFFPLCMMSSSHPVSPSTVLLIIPYGTGAQLFRNGIKQIIFAVLPDGFLN